MPSARLALFGLLSGAIALISCKQSAPNSDVLGEAPKAKTESVEAKAQDGPFGLRIGQPISELSYAEPGGEAGVYSLTSVPKPMTEVDTYAVLAFPDTGICEIRAASKDFDSDAYGVNVKAAIDSLAKAIDSKYGSHKKIDDCSDYNCQFFQQNLTSGSQAYFYEWSRKTGANMPNELGDIVLGAVAGQFNDTFYRLDYTSSNSKACEVAKASSKAKAL